MSKQLNDLLNDDTHVKHEHHCIVCGESIQQPFILSPEGEAKQPAPGQLEKRSMESEMAALFAYLDDTVKEWGEKNVYKWIDEWFIREIND